MENPRDSRRKEILKIRAEINAKETKETIAKINKAKSWFFERWDEKSFELPEEYKLKENSELADALKVFYAAGGYNFFNVINPEYYASNWLEFMGKLYGEIMEDKYVFTSKIFSIPLDDEQREELASRHVPDRFICDIK